MGFSRFRNFWSDVYDFTPSPDNWSFLPKASFANLLQIPRACHACWRHVSQAGAVSQDVTGTELLMPISDDVKKHLASDLAEAVPQTHGQRPLMEKDKGCLFMLFQDTASKTALEFAHTAANQGVLLLRTNEGKIDQQAADQLQASCGWDPELIASLQAKAHISLEFRGAGCDVVEALANASEGVVRTSTLPQVAQHFRFAGLAY
ncbi:Protein Xrp2 [Trebouxia sp. C0010 RCD-2024]